MTNYNERLVEILEKFRDSEQYSNGFDGYENIFYTKQALTSLIKELVAEAKPKEMDSFYEKPIVEEFEQNLLKGLEKVQ